MLNRITEFLKAAGAIILAAIAAALVIFNWKSIRGDRTVRPQQLPDKKATDHVTAAGKEVSDANARIDSMSDGELADSINKRYGSGSNP